MKDSDGVESADKKSPMSMDRRSLLKAGAVAGVGGILAVAGASAPAAAAAVPAQPSNGEAPKPKNPVQSLHLLIDSGAMNPFNEVTSFYLPPNSTVHVKQSVPAGQVAVVTSDKIDIGHDHSLALSLVIDGKTILFDPDVVQARYAQPIHAMFGNPFYTIRAGSVLSVTNKSSRTRYFSHMQSGGLVSSTAL